jgi:zinc transport system substrate-binding protein
VIARRAALVLLGAALTVAACERSPSSAPTSSAVPRPLVIASFYPLYEFARQVAGERAEVVVLVPAGVEPHEWEPSPQDVARLQRARLVVHNGAGFEPWVDKLRPDIQAKGAVLVDASKGLPLLTRARGGEAGHRAGRPGAAPAEVDPHVWLDPVLAQAQVETIRAALAAAEAGGATAYADGARAFTARLAALDETFRTGLKDCARRDLFTSHAAFGYLARRYELRQVALLGLAPDQEPSPADLAALTRVARRDKVQAIFFETLVSPRLAETLAREVGARALPLNPLEGLTREELAAGKSYVPVMEENLVNLRAGLGCR